MVNRCRIVNRRKSLKFFIIKAASFKNLNADSLGIKMAVLMRSEQGSAFGPADIQPEPSARSSPPDPNVDPWFRVLLREIL